MTIVLLAAGGLFLSPRPLCAQTVSYAGTAVNFGAVNVCPARQTTPAPRSAMMTLNFTVTASGTLGARQVLTLGDPDLDFTLASGSTCTGSVTQGNSCTVNVKFAPIAPGVRRGAVVLQDAGGNRLVTAFIYGTGTGPAIAFTPSPSITLGNGFGVFHPGVSVDGAGNLFIGDTESNSVKEVLAAGGYITVLNLGSDFEQPWGTAVDGSGNVFVANNTTGNVNNV